MLSGCAHFVAAGAFGCLAGRNIFEFVLQIKKIVDRKKVTVIIYNNNVAH
jgi:DhnA family fructose-bisphosphate aldolase class Ia